MILPEIDPRAPTYGIILGPISKSKKDLLGQKHMQ